MEESPSYFEMDVPHALQIKEVLEHILGYCTLSDLQKCRLVSTFWRQSAVKSFKSFPVSLTSAEKTREFVRILEDPRPVAGSRAALYANFIFSNSSLSLRGISKIFWTLVGSNIKILELSNIKFQTVDEWRIIVLNHCPNLKDLTLQHVSLTTPVAGNIAEPEVWQAPQFGENKSVRCLKINQKPCSLGISWMELVNFFPSLKALKLEEALPIHFELFKSIQRTREHDATRLELNEIQFQFADQPTIEPFENLVFNFRVLALLLETKLHSIKKFSLDLNGGLGAQPVNVLLLVEILGRQADTLEKFTIRRNLGERLDPRVVFLFHEAAKLNCLQVLELKCPVFTSLKFLELMPNLRKLSFCEPDFEEMDIPDIQLVKCKELKVSCKVSMKGLEILLKLVPNVENLEMHLDNEMFRLVCQGWPNLVTLKIVNSRVDECGITGMDEEDVKRVNGQHEKSNWRPITVRKANMTSLKHLRRFYMRVDSISADDPFNNFMGYCGKLYGFQEMTDLEMGFQNYNFDKKAYRERNGGKKCIICISQQFGNFF